MPPIPWHILGSASPIFGMLKYCSSSHIVNRLLPHFILSWIHYSIKKRAFLKIYNVILPQFSPCQHPISSASHLPEYITKIFHYKRSCHSEMNTNGAVFDLIRVEWSFDLSPRFNNGLPIMCQFRFLPCFPASLPHLPHISQVSTLFFLVCLFVFSDDKFSRIPAWRMISDLLVLIYLLAYARAAAPGICIRKQKLLPLHLQCHTCTYL